VKYAWRLEVKVWTSKRLEGEIAEEFQPTLVLVRHGYETDRVMGWIEYEPKSRDTLKAGWNAHCINDDDNGSGERERSWYVDKGSKRRPLLGKGETKHPRDSAHSALTALIELMEPYIEKAEHAALSRVGPMLLAPLQEMVKSYVQRFPQAADRSRGPRHAPRL
jgi:hypothetical protein